MSYADKMYLTYMFIAFLVVAVSFSVLMLPSFRAFITVKVVTVVLLVLPFVLLSTFIAMDQIPKIGFSGFASGDFMCGGVHGAGYRADCSLYEVVFEGVISTFIFSFVSFGLIPLAVFAFLLLLFVAVRRNFSH